MVDLGRLRWRLAGATMWPAFGLFLLAGTLVLTLLPPWGEQGLDAVPAFLLSGFFALVVVAAGAPLGGLLWRSRRPDVPKVVADDRAGTVLLGALLAALLVGGVLHRDVVAAEDDERLSQAIAARTAVLAQAPPEFRAGADRLDTAQQGPDLYRTCAPSARDDRRAWCVLVTTDQHPPGISVDPDRRPNDVVFGPRSPGRIGGG